MPLPRRGIQKLYNHPQYNIYAQTVITTMNLPDTQHSEILFLVDELKAYVSAGYTAPTDIFINRLDRINEILWENYPKGDT